MTRLRRYALAAVAAFSVIVSTLVSDANAAGFRRGATLVEFFNFPATVGDGTAKAYTNPAYPKAATALSEFNFDDLRRIGFDHMRVPVDLGPLMWGDEDERRDIIQKLETVIGVLHRHDLGVLVTLYPPSLQHELPETYLDGLDGPKFTRYFEIVQRIAGALASVRSGLVALEPMNEPQSQCRAKSGPDWTAYQEFMVERIRRSAPDLPLFLTGGCWSNIEGIVLLDSDLLRDRRNYISVHFYYPFLFTHQGAGWTMPHLAGTTGVPYPASAGSEASVRFMTRERFKTVPLAAGVDRNLALQKAEREISRYYLEGQGPPAMQRWMKQVADWQQRQRVHPEQVVFTEFGAMKQTQDGIEFDKASRARWLQDASSLIEQHGFGWTVYVLKDDPFGLYQQKNDRYPDPKLLRALRLNTPKEAY